MPSAMDKAGEGLLLAGQALQGMFFLAREVAPQVYDLAERTGGDLVTEARRVADQAERVADIVDAAAKQHGIEVDAR